MLPCRDPGPHYLWSLRNTWCMWWRSWMRHCRTSRKVAGSIPDGVIGIIHCHKPSGCTVTLVSTQPLTEMSTRNIYWGKGGRCIRLTLLPPSCADCLEIWKPQSPGNPKTCTGIALAYYFLIRICSLEATLLWLLKITQLRLQIREVTWSVVMWSELTWLMWSDFVLKLSEMKCSEVS